MASQLKLQVPGHCPAVTLGMSYIFSASASSCIKEDNSTSKMRMGTSLVVQWLGICLPMQWMGLNPWFRN